MADGEINNTQRFTRAATFDREQIRPGHHQIIKNGVTQPGYSPVSRGKKRAIHDETPYRYPGSHRCMG